MATQSDGYLSELAQTSTKNNKFKDSLINVIRSILVLLVSAIAVAYLLDWIL